MGSQKPHKIRLRDSESLFNAKGGSEEIDYIALAEKYGVNEYASKKELLEADLIELIARTIYGEQTKKEKQGQDAVVWTIANRLLAQKKSEFSINNEPSNLFNIVTKPSAYTCLDKETGNVQSYTSKTGDNTGWVNAVKLSYELVTFFDENYVEGVPLTKEEIEKLRQQLESNMCSSPIGSGCYYRASDTFEKQYGSTTDGKHYFNGVEIYPPQSHEGNTFFSYK